MNLKVSLPLLVSALALGACSDPTDYNFDQSVIDGFTDVNAAIASAELASANLPSEAVFDPANGLLPFPNALLFGGSEDGTLNIPVAEDVAGNFGDPSVALNTLDGFSTTQPMNASFGKALDPASVLLGENVLVYEVTTDANGLVTGVVSELGAGQVAAVAVGSSIAILPLAPLKESTDYVVLITNGVLGADGQAVTANRTFGWVAGTVPLTGAPVAPLEPLRRSVNSMLEAAGALGVDRTTVVQAWSTKTQSITPVMNAVKNASQSGGAIAVAPTGLTTNNINEALPGIADVYIGTLDVPYYLAQPEGPNDAAAIASFWRGEGGSFLTRFNPQPIATSVQTIPVLMTLPNANSGQAMPEAGWPIVIFVHGVTNDRTNMFAIADSMAQAGFAVVAIDQAMHGITDATSPLAAANTPFPNDRERTFDIDLVNNETGEAGPDGIVDPSGRHYYSPAQLLNTRDNLRQSAADLLVLSASLGSIPGVAVDVTRKAVIGHSLGGSTATTFAAFDDSVNSVSLGMPAAGMVQTTIASLSFGPPIKAGLSAAGLEEGTPEFARFVVAAQTIVDSGDPINFGAQLASMHPVHMIEVVGNGTEDSPADTVVFNAIPGAPLAGTEALARVMGLTTITATTSGSGLVKFTGGDHGSLLSPASSGRLDVTTEMQTQLATFAASGGTLIQVSNTDVIVTSE